MVNPGMARLLTEYLRLASKKYRKLRVIYMYWWPDVPRDPFVDMMRGAGIVNLEVHEEYIMASPRFGAKLGWKGASLFRAFIHNIRTINRLAGYLKREKVDVIHFILTDYQANYTIAKAGRIAGVPYIVLSFTGISPPNTKRKRFFNRLTDKMLDRVITASAIDAKTATEEAFPTAPKTVCTGFGLAPNLFAGGNVNPQKIREEFNIPPGAPVIGTTTRIAPGKGQDHLIRALPMVVEKYPDIRVFILGGRYDKDQPYTGELMSLAKELGVDKNVIFTGERTDAPDIFACYLFAVHFPDYDHLPFGVLECGAMSIPTIGTAVGGVPEIIDDGKTGVLLDTHDTEKMSEAIISLTGDEGKRKRMGDAMREFVLRRYDLGALVERVGSLYGDLIKGEVKDVYE